MQKTNRVGGGGPGRGRGVGLERGQGVCERRSEVILKIRKKSWSGRIRMRGQGE